jgi:hypothetical protein
MALFGQDRPQIGGGWAALGSMLGGGGAVAAEQAYADQAFQNYRAKGAKADWELALEKAGRERDQRIAMQQIGETLGALGQNPALGGIFQASSGGNADQMIQAVLGGQEFATRDAARAAALGGDLVGANANLFGVASGPVDTTKISGGMVYNPIGSPDQPMAVTPLGQSEIDYDRARIAKTMAAPAGGGGLGKPPAGYMWAGEGQLAPIPGGPADPAVKAAGKPATSKGAAPEVKGAQVANLTRGLERIRGALGGLGGRLVDTGPLDQYVQKYTPEGQELEAAVGSIRPSLMALTRVPGVGAQSDLEARLEGLRFPSLGFAPDVNQATTQQLEAFVSDLMKAYQNVQTTPPAGGGAPGGVLRYNPATGDFE